MRECRAGEPLALFCDVGGERSTIEFKHLHVKLDLEPVDHLKSYAPEKVRDKTSHLHPSLTSTHRPPFPPYPITPVTMSHPHMAVAETSRVRLWHLKVHLFEQFKEPGR